MLLKVSRDATKLAMCANQYLGIVDLASGQVRDIYASPEDSEERIWALDWSADDRQLLTIFRSSGGMEKMEMVIFPAGGGAPTRQPISNQLRGLSLSPDGKYLGTTRVTRRTQVWALENFLPAK